MYCKDCKFYKVNRVDGPYCTKSTKPRPVSPLRKMDCFVEPSGDDEVPAILASVPDKAVEEAPVEKPKRRGGRPKSHPNYVDENGVTMKWCRVCQQYKPLDEFGKKSSAADGHTYECKKCKVDHQRKKRDEKRQNKKASVRVKKSLEKKLAPLADAIPKVSAIDEMVFTLPLDLFSGNMEMTVVHREKSLVFEIRRKDEKKGMDI